MPPVVFLPLAVNPSDYPRSILSMLPATTRLAGPLAGDRRVASAFLDCPDFFVQGRYALAEALKRAGVVRGSVVLLPSYHCRTIVESVLFLGAEARFYPMTETLRPDFPAMDRQVADGRARVLLLTHYFGFPNALPESVRFCETHGLDLVEDCAHAFYGSHAGRVLGTAGRYAVASAWKFLPLRDGAVLRDNWDGQAGTVLRRPALRSEIRAAAVMLRNKLLGIPPRPVLPVPDYDTLVRHARRIGASRPPDAGAEGIQFLPEQVDMSGQAVSRWLVRHAEHDRVIRRRRENYLHWLAGVAGLAGVRPLFDRLPDGTVPYAFPLLTDAAGLVFHALKLAGIPIWRWEDVATTDCPISQGYRLRLLQLPCHQDLRREEIDWMVAVLRGVLPGLLGTAGPGPD